MSPDIILYAIIAIILLARLWSLFGQRHDTDQQRPNPFATPATSARDDRDAVYAPSANAPPALEGTGKPSVLPKSFIPPASLAGGLEQVKALYPAFDEKAFLQNCRTSFSQIVDAFAKGDLTPVESSVGAGVLAQFRAAIEARRASGQTLECRIEVISDIEMTASRIEDKRAFITVSITSQQITTLRDNQGAIIGGQENQREQIADVWVFMRDTSASEANWILIATRS